MGWVPGPSDEGIHTVEFRATDRSGNTSYPVSITFTVDLTPPSPPVIGSPADGSKVTSETVDIRGAAEAGATVVMAFGGLFEAPADMASGEFVFERVKLSPGSNDFAFTAKDRAGNVSGATAYRLVYSAGVVMAEVTAGKAEYGPNEEVLMISIVRNATAAETYDDLTVRVSIAGGGVKSYTRKKRIPVPWDRVEPSSSRRIGTRGQRARGITQ